jgi:hypothetical protein
MATVLGASWSSFGALLIGVGALLLLADALFSKSPLDGWTFNGTLPQPDRRLSASVAVVGSLLVAAGSIILLVDASTLTARAVLVVSVGTALLVYLMMAVRLREYRRPDPLDANPPPHSLWWCLRHPLWRPPPR